MHAIRDKHTNKVLYIDYSSSEAPQPGKLVYPDFDDQQMEIGWTELPYIPAWFDIDKTGVIQELDLDEAANRGLYQLEPGQKLVKGKIVDMEKDELVAEGLLKLDDMKQQMLEFYNALSFHKRNELIPAYRLNNAALGVYDEKRVADYRATIQAFRDEAKRISDSINEATSVKELESIQENFPTSIISA